MQKEQNAGSQLHETSYFSTRDLHLASTLITLGFFMDGIDYQYEGARPRPVGYFNFVEVPEIADQVKKYRQCMLQVDAKTLFSNMKSLLAEVNNTYKNPHTTFVEQD